MCECDVCYCENCMRRGDDQLNYIFDDTDLKEYWCYPNQRRVTERDYCSLDVKRNREDKNNADA